VLAKSVQQKKQKTLTLSIRKNNKSQTITLPFTLQTKGIGHAVKGRYIIVNTKKNDGVFTVTEIIPDFSGLMAGVQEISINDVQKKLYTKKNFALIDTRSHLAFQQSHLPTARSLPSCKMTEHLDVLPEKKAQLIVLYCENETCGTAVQASIIAADAGYTHVRVLKAGVKGWLDKGYKTVASDRFVKSKKLILVDLRSQKEYFSKRIAGAVSIPLATLATRSEQFSVKDPVVVYSDRITESLEGLGILHAKNIQSIAMVEGNLQGWKKRGNATVSGKASSTTFWHRQSKAGEVSAQEFAAAVASGGAGVLILDVRTPKEVKQGMFRGAQHIALYNLPGSFSEIPREKKIFIYCKSGPRAKMAAELLKRQGFTAYYLWAEVTCNSGNCRVQQ